MAFPPMMNQPEDEQAEQGNEETSVESLEQRVSTLEQKVAALEAKSKPTATAGGIVASKDKGFFGS